MNKAIINFFIVFSTAIYVILEALKNQLEPLATVYPPIPRATAFADAAMNRQPLAAYAPKHPAVTILNKIQQGMEKL